MPLVRDFRNLSFKLERIDRCGRHVGSKLYWKLYSVENTVRIAVHSILSAQLGANWWALAVSPTIMSKATRFRAAYAAKPKNASPGISDIHLIFLGDLTEIIRANSNLFLPIVPDTHNWISTLEAIRVPRNLVGHMNFPNAFDRHAIDSAFAQLPSLLANLALHGVSVLVPR